MKSIEGAEEVVNLYVDDKKKKNDALFLEFYNGEIVLGPKNFFIDMVPPVY